MKSIKYWLALAIYRKFKVIEDIAKYQIYSKYYMKFAYIGKNCCVDFDHSTISGYRYTRIGDNFSVGKFFRMEAIDIYGGYQYTPVLTIGNNVRIEDYCQIGCIERVSIGNNVLIASKVFISDHNHGNITNDDIDIPPARRPLSSKPVEIGDNVWICDNVSILPGVKLGKNVIVGANTVVTHSFPANTVIAGCPAKVIRFL